MRRRSWFIRSCTPVEARWCPIHGTCTCTELNARGHRIWAENMDHDDCPLHGLNSRHPSPRHQTVLHRRVRS